MFLVFLTFFVASFFIFSCDSVFAWGPGIHILQGEFVLNHLGLVLPCVRELLQSNSVEFLYGCISADIFIGKGSRRRDDHCHNWSTGKKMLSEAGTSSEKAFAYGYLCHLAADTVAHNFYIPNQLYRTSTTTRLGHLYWEFRSDMFADKQCWKVARDIVATHDRRNDLFVSQRVSHRMLSFKTKKRIYTSTIRLCDLEQWQKTVVIVSENSRWDVPREYVEFFKNISFCLTIDFLRCPDEAVCCNLDPVGSEMIREAKRRRRLMRRVNGENPQGMGFNLPTEVMEAVVAIEKLTASS